jgi:hypothetical protein
MAALDSVDAAGEQRGRRASYIAPPLGKCTSGACLTRYGPGYLPSRRQAPKSSWHREPHGSYERVGAVTSGTRVAARSASRRTRDIAARLPNRACKPTGLRPAL